MYCAYCGTPYTETEIFNASQRIKQDVIMRKWSAYYFFGGMAVFLFILPVLLNSLIPDKTLHEAIKFLALFPWLLLVIKRPLAQTYALKLYPEKSA